MAAKSGTRKRVPLVGKKPQDSTKKARQSEKLSTEEEHVEDVPSDKTKIASSYRIDGGSYWLTRIVFVRALAFVYCKRGVYAFVLKLSFIHVLCC